MIILYNNRKSYARGNEMKNKKIVILGLNFGKHIADELSAGILGIELYGVCDIDEKKTDSIAEKHGVKPFYSLDNVLLDENVDAIGVFTGPNGRAAIISLIINSGRDVMTTKPFESNDLSAQKVLEEAEKLGRIIHMNSPNPRPFGEMIKIQEWIKEGKIGKPTLAHSDVWAYYGPTKAEAGSWYDDPITCPVAPIFRLGIYPLNNLLTIFGEPEEVQVITSKIETEKPTPDNASLTIKFTDGAILNLQGSFVVGGPDKYKNSLTICGTKGVIYFETGPRNRNEYNHATLTLSTDDEILEVEIKEKSGLYDWEYFLHCVNGGEKDENELTISQVVKSVKLMKAISKAELSGQTIKLADFHN